MNIAPLFCARSIGRVRRAALRLLLASGSLLAGHAACGAPLTLAIAELPVFGPALVAEAEGYYGAEGLELTLLHCKVGRLCLQHLVDGKAHLATVADMPLVMSAHAGHVFDIVATMAVSREQRLVARADRGIRSVADLKGKRIGFLGSTGGHYFAESAIVLNGVDPAAVTLVPLDADTAVESLAAGKVDAAALYQPYRHQAAQRLGSKIFEPASTRLFSATINLVSLPGPAAVSDADLVKVLRALRRACALMQAEPARAKALIAKRLKLDPALLDISWPGYEFRLSLEQSLLTSLEAQSRWALREKLVPVGSMPDYLERIRPGPLRQIDRRAVSLVK